jgi:hypothetical protein
VEDQSVETNDIQTERVFRLTASPIELRTERILADLLRAGFPSLPFLEALVKELLPFAREISAPKASGRILPMDSAPLSEVRAMPPLIWGSEYLLVAVCTAGEGFDRGVSELTAKGAGAKSIVLDAIARCALSRIAGHLTDAVAHWAHSRDLQTSRAFLPGLAGDRWDLGHQAWMLAEARADEIGVRLTESQLMVPTKSVSFVVGLGREIPEAGNPFSCAGCVQRDCSYRLDEADEMLHYP